FADEHPNDKGKSKYMFWFTCGIVTNEDPVGDSGAVRVIGYGKTRPQFILSKKSPGFADEHPADKGKSKYMFWFTGGIVTNEDRVGDAGAGTFYSCMSNIDIRIEDGNPQAVALRTHFAQHSFVSYMTINIGKGKAGLFDVGNEMENIAFIGGEYGIFSTKASPGWQVMMADCYFEGQRKAAIYAQEAGLAIVNLQAKNVPTVYEIQEGFNDRVFMENCRFENVTGPAIVIATENNSNTDVTLRDIVCSKVPVLVKYLRTGEQTKVADKVYCVKSFNHGLQMASLTDTPAYRTDMDIVPLAKLPAVLKNDIPQLPGMETWVNVRDYGAKGDGKTDDTQAIRRAMAAGDNVYFPTGWYIVSETIKMNRNTKFIGLHPFATQLKLLESTPAFSSFGAPAAILESSEGGQNFLNGIGINTGAFNYRAVGVKWMAGADSYMNDVKYVGGHGTMRKPTPAPQGGQQNRGGARPGGASNVSTPENPVRAAGFDNAWDNQHWSLWVNRGGGTFKDIWTANTYATNGFLATDTDVPARIYAMSIEHHVRSEVRLRNVANWKIYCMQTEEESVESKECQPLELDDCHNITFAELYMFRVIRFNWPYHSSVRMRGCRDIEFLNVHNFGQVKYSNDIPIYDQAKEIEVRPWEFARLTVTGNEASTFARTSSTGTATRIAGDLEFAEGVAHDSKGNLYFCDHRLRRVWQWNPEKGLKLLADFPWKPDNVAVDTKDNVIVTFRYDRQPGFAADPITVQSLPDASGTSFSGWGNSGFATLAYSIDPKDPENSIRLLDLVPMGSVTNVAKALYPSNRWRDFHDFWTNVVFRPEKCFVAPDGRTIIPQQYDLVRSTSLIEAIPGKRVFLSDDYDRRVVSAAVAADGSLSDPKIFVERGEFGVATDAAGNVYVADGEVLVYGPDGSYKRTIRVPERPASLTIVGSKLYITARSGVYVHEI
ncbi:MAG: SMP-30/gluconolactonase/LRE family protein, partial [Bacteroidales bacterium]|nr:SMP-30/gluconolactonase/LRE family protein [Bacteroidales bacterium]